MEVVITASTLLTYSPDSADSNNVSKTAGGLICFGLLALVFPLFILVNSYNAVYSASPGLIAANYVIVLWSATRLSMFGARGELAWMAVFFYIYVYIWLGIASMAQAASGTAPLGQQAPEAVRATAVVIVAVGLVAYEIGRLKGIKSDKFDLSFSERKLDLRRVMTVAVVACAVSLALIPALGGLSVLFTSREAASAAALANGSISDTNKSANALIRAAASTPPFVALYGLTRFRVQTGFQRNFTYSLLLLCMLFVNGIVNNPISNARYVFGTYLFAFVISSTRITLKRSVSLVAAGIIIAALLLFPYSDFSRRSGTTVGDLQAQGNPISQLSSKGDYDSAQQISNGVLYASDRGHTLGRQELGAVFFWIPRVVWENKANDTGTLLGNYINYPNKNLSAPLWIESWLDLSWPGLFIVFFFFGRVSKKLDAGFSVKTRNKFSLTALMVPPLAGYQIIILRGSLLQAMSSLAALVLVLFLITKRETISTADRDNR